MSRLRGDRPWHDCAAWVPAAAVVPYPPPAPGADRPFFYHHDQWLWCYAGICAAGASAGPLAHCSLHPRPAAQPVYTRGSPLSPRAATIRGRAVIKGRTMTPRATLLPRGQRLQRRALLVGLLATGLCVLGYYVHPAQFFRAYLVAYLFWFGVVM